MFNDDEWYSPLHAQPHPPPPPSANREREKGGGGEEDSKKRKLAQAQKAHFPETAFLYRLFIPDRASGTNGSFDCEALRSCAHARSHMTCMQIARDNIDVIRYSRAFNGTGSKWPYGVSDRSASTGGLMTSHAIWLFATCDFNACVGAGLVEVLCRSCTLWGEFQLRGRTISHPKEY